MADLVVTDPPYNVNYEGGTKDALKIQNDNMDDASFLAFLIDAFKTMKEALKPGGAFYLSLIHISEPTRQCCTSRMPSSA